MARIGNLGLFTWRRQTDTKPTCFTEMGPDSMQYTDITVVFKECYANHNIHTSIYLNIRQEPIQVIVILNLNG